MRVDKGTPLFYAYIMAYLSAKKQLFFAISGYICFIFFLHVKDTILCF